MSRDHYAWGSLRRTGRQLVFLAALSGVGLVLLVVLLVVFGAGE
jgi:hypothetical protein